jgi:hypothetical protein
MKSVVFYGLSSFGNLSWCSASSRQAFLIRFVFFGSTVTARQRQCRWFSIVRISLFTIFEVSIVQYNMSVKVVGAVFEDEKVRMVLG